MSPHAPPGAHGCSGGVRQLSAPSAARWLLALPWPRPGGSDGCAARRRATRRPCREKCRHAARRGAAWRGSGRGQESTTRRWARSTRAHHGRGRAGRSAGARVPRRLTRPPGPMVTAPIAGGRRRLATATAAVTSPTASTLAVAASVRSGSVAAVDEYLAQPAEPAVFSGHDDHTRTCGPGVGRGVQLVRAAPRHPGQAVPRRHAWSSSALPAGGGLRQPVSEGRGFLASLGRVLPSSGTSTRLRSGRH
ncbi:hypothetical protein JD81_02126 [Micromonospora sagamiensis]|uniref:Uncharacterized protein n=1 Tax=Micromonospora sagamiensis TaxID=47875 RepID=A0A562WEY8_9ACTN|nr:hypothetical protein JD81_02126 [Micromonospora sagamiensis]